jgi:hypothetical protein
VYQGFPETGQALILRSEDAGTSVILLPATHDASFPERLHVNLTQVGDVYYLSEVATDLGVYTLPVPSEPTRTAKTKDQGAMAPSGSN